MQKKYILTGIFTLCFIVLVIVILKGKEPTDLTPVSIGNGTHAITGLLAIAEQEGFFTDEGLDVEIVPYGSGALAFSAMRTGKHEFSTVAETPIVLNQFEEDRVKILATVGNTDDEEKVIARKNAGITKPGDLRGKRVAIHKKGTSPHFFLYLYLLSNKLTLDDIELLVVPVEELQSALVNGEIDAAVMSEPLASETLTVLAENKTLLTETGLYSRAYNLVTLDSVIEESPELVTKVLRALTRAEKFARENREKAIEDVSVSFEIEGSVLEDVWGDQRLEVSLTQSFLSMLDDQARWAIEEQLVEGHTEIPNFLDAIYFEGLSEVKPEGVTIIQ